jgi:hypothetical protein
VQADQQLEKNDPEEEHESQARAAGFPTGKARETVGRMRRLIIGAAGGSVDLKIARA